LQKIELLKLFILFHVEITLLNENHKSFIIVVG